MSGGAPGLFGSGGEAGQHGPCVYEGVTHQNETFACDCNVCWCDGGEVWSTPFYCEPLGFAGGFGDIELGAGGAAGGG